MQLTKGCVLLVLGISQQAIVSQELLSSWRWSWRHAYLRAGTVRQRSPNEATSGEVYALFSLRRKLIGPTQYLCDDQIRRWLDGSPLHR
ncbi:hypothetical protein CH274_20060 [Rhodococcus sp. 06-418-5]|nr:hypothetical protein CH274_20060 [Rhodococcus sp. 06-418-5]